MSRIFLSHSSANNAEAIAVRDWLAGQGFDDIFLDLDPARGLKAGDRWEQALNEAAGRCEAVVFLVSHAWIASAWCRKEMSLAHRLNKRMFGVLIEDLGIDEVPKDLSGEWQLVRLASGRDGIQLTVVLPVKHQQETVTFSEEGLQRLKHGLESVGLDPKHFAWPPDHHRDRAPYRGFKALEAHDAGIFFGRDGAIITALDMLRGLREAAPPRLFVILGASGAGKSSFMRAGLIPRLERDDRHFLPLPVVRPERGVLTGEAGFLRALEAAFRVAGIPRSRADLRAVLDHGADAVIALMAKLAAHKTPPALNRGDATKPPTLVIAIDQAEELFNTDGDAEARAFLALLARLLTTPHPDLIAVLTIRTDAYEPLQSAAGPAAPLAELKQTTFPLQPMAKGAYQSVIEGPARRLTESGRKLEISPDLTAQLLADIEAGGAKDALPLLAFTLERLYLEHGADGKLTLNKYEALGGIKGAVEAAVAHALKAADANPAIPRDASARQKLLRRGLIPWLAGIDPDTGQPRRQVARLSEIPDEARPVIDLLVEARLLATDTDAETGETTIEPAHEALLRQWGLLEGWLEDDFASLATLSGVKRAATEWEANARRGAWLAHAGDRLAEAERTAALPAFEGYLTASERDYLATARVAEMRRIKRERFLNRAVRAAAVIALILMGVAGWQWREARQQTEVAEQAATRARTEEQRAEDEAERARKEAVLSQALALSSRASALAAAMPGHALIMSEHARRIEQSELGEISPLTEQAIRDAAALLEGKVVGRGQSAITALAVRPDGKFLVWGSAYGRVGTVFLGGEGIDPRNRDEWAHPDAIVSVGFLPDGSWISQSGYESLTHWQFEDEASGRVKARRIPFTENVAPVGVGEWKVVSGGGESVHHWRDFEHGSLARARSGQSLQIGDTNITSRFVVHRPNVLQALLRDGASQRVLERFAGSKFERITDFPARVDLWNYQPVRPGSDSSRHRVVMRSNKLEVLGLLVEQSVSAREEEPQVDLSLKLGLDVNAITGHERWIAAGTSTGLIECALRPWDAAEPIRFTIEAHDDLVTFLLPSARGQLLISGGADGRLAIWSMAANDAQRSFVSWHLPTGFPITGVLSPSHRSVFVGDSEGMIHEYGVYGSIDPEASVVIGDPLGGRLDAAEARLEERSFAWRRGPVEEEASHTNAKWWESRNARLGGSSPCLRWHWWRGESGHFMVDATASLHPLNFREIEGRPLSVDFSPGPNEAMFLLESRELLWLNLESGKERRRINVPGPGKLQRAVLGPDGEHVAVLEGGVATSVTCAVYRVEGDGLQLIGRARSKSEYTDGASLGRGAGHLLLFDFKSGEVFKLEGGEFEPVGSCSGGSGYPSADDVQSTWPRLLDPHPATLSWSEREWFVETTETRRSGAPLRGDQAKRFLIGFPVIHRPKTGLLVLGGDSSLGIGDLKPAVAVFDLTRTGDWHQPTYLNAPFGSVRALGLKDDQRTLLIGDDLGQVRACDLQASGDRGARLLWQAPGEVTALAAAQRDSRVAVGLADGSIFLLRTAGEGKHLEPIRIRGIGHPVGDMGFVADGRRLVARTVGGGSSTVYVHVFELEADRLVDIEASGFGRNLSIGEWRRLMGVRGYERTWPHFDEESSRGFRLLQRANVMREHSKAQGRLSGSESNLLQRTAAETLDEELASAADPARAGFHLATALFAVAIQVGEWDGPSKEQAIALWQRAAKLLDEHVHRSAMGVLSVRVQCRLWAARTLLRDARPREAILEARRALALIPEYERVSGDDQSRARSFIAQVTGLAAIQTEELGTAITHFERALVEGKDHASPRWLKLSLLGLMGVMARETGGEEAAEASEARLRELGKEILTGVTSAAPQALADAVTWHRFEAALAARRGQDREALVNLTHALRMAEQFEAGQKGVGHVSRLKVQVLIEIATWKPRDGGPGTSFPEGLGTRPEWIKKLRGAWSKLATESRDMLELEVFREMQERLNRLEQTGNAGGADRLKGPPYSYTELLWADYPASVLELCWHSFYEDIPMITSFSRSR